MSERNPPRIILQGSVPVQMLTPLSNTFEAWYPNSICLDPYHPFSKSHNATLCIVSKDDPILKENADE